MRRRNVAFVAVFLALAACRRASGPAVPPAAPVSISAADKAVPADRGDASAGRLSAVRAVAPLLASPPPPAPAAAPARVVIVGGGIAGLVAGYELEKRGVPVRILEADSVLGGRVATIDYPGEITAEAGLQELWGDNPLLPIARELSVPLDDHPLKAYSSVVIDGKVYPYVKGSKESFFDTLMSSADKAALLAWLAEAEKLRTLAQTAGLGDPRIEKLQSMSFSAWVLGAGLDRNASELLRLVIECEVGTGWQQISALFGLLEFGVFLGEGQLAYHVHGGNSRLIEGLSRAISGEKTLSATVMRIERRQDADGGIKLRVFYDHDRRIYAVDAERVVLAVPFWRLHQIEIVPPLSEKKWQAVFSLQRGQYTVVHLRMPQAAAALWELDGHSPLALLTDGPLGVVYGAPERPAGRLSAGGAAGQDEAMIFSLLVHGSDAAAFHMAPRELRLRDIYADLDKLWPGLSARVQSSFVYTYHPGAIPVFPPGRSPLDGLAQALRQPELGLYLAGDYLYNAHSDGAARSGIRAAEEIAAELPLSQAALSRPRPPTAPPPARHRK